MGNNNVSPPGLQVYRPSRPGEWVRQGTTGYCDLVKNTQTGELAEQYTIPVDRRIRREEDLRRYELRRNQPFIVKVLQVEKEEAQHICQGQDFLRVKTEHIPKRLSEVTGLSQPEALYVLQETLQGYKIIHQFQGPFTINEEMIGFTSAGQVRVWLNENFARNLPDLQNMVAGKLGNGFQQNSDSLLIDQIYDLVESRVAGGSFPEKFRMMYTQNPPKTFDEALSIIQTYSNNHNVSIPTSVSASFGGQSTTNVVIAPQPTSVIAPQTQTVVQTSSINQAVNSVSPIQMASQNIGASINGARSQLVLNQPVFQQSHPTRAVSVAPTNTQSHVIIGQQYASHLAPGVHSRVISRPANLSLSQVQTARNMNVNTSLTDIRRQEWNPPKTVDISNRFSLPHKSVPFNNFSARQPINFRLNNVQQSASTTIPNVTTSGQVQFARRGAKTINTTLPVSLPKTTGINERFTVSAAQTEVKNEVKVVAPTAALKPSVTSTPAPTVASINQGKQLSEALNLERNIVKPAEVKTEVVQRNLTNLIKAEPVVKEEANVQKHVRFGSQPVQSQPTIQQPTQVFGQQHRVINTQTVNETVKTTVESGTVKEVDISTAPKVIKIDNTVPVERVVKADSGLKKESNFRGQDTPGFSQKFQGSPERIEAKAEAKEIPVYRVGEARVIGTRQSPVARQSPKRVHVQQTQPVQRTQQVQSSQNQFITISSEGRRILQGLRQEPAQHHITVQPRAVVVDEITVTENSRGQVQAHEAVITTEYDARGNANSSGYVVDYSSKEPEIVGGVTYSTTQITDYTAAEDPSGRRYIRGHTYEYANDNPVKEYEMYIDSSTGVDRLESFRIGDQRPRLPLDYQQIVSNSSSTSGGYTSQQYQSGQSAGQWRTQTVTGPQPTVYNFSDSAGYTQPQTKLPSYSELSQSIKTGASAGYIGTTTATPGPENIRRPVKVAPGLLD